MSNSGKVLFNGFVSSKSKKSNNNNRRNIRKISREKIQQIKNQSVKKYDNKHRIFNINKNRLRQNYRNNYNNIGNYRNNYIKNAGIINKSKNNQHNINSSYSSSTSKVLFSNASSNSSSNYYNILDNYNFSDGLNVIKSVNLNGKNIKSITTSKSTVKLITLKDTTGCDLNFIFNIEGGPQGEQGPDGKSLTSVTYTLGQDVGTTSGVTFNTIEATNPSSYSLNGVNVTSTEWAHLVTMNQDVSTSAGVTFNTVNGRDITVDGSNLDDLIAIGLTGLTTDEVNQLKNIDTTIISSTQWGYLGTMDQDVNTSADVSFNTVNGRDITVDGNNLDALTSIGLTGLTTDEVNQLKNIDTTIISSTQWGYLGAMDQDVSTSAGVTFNELTLPDSKRVTLRTLSDLVQFNGHQDNQLRFYFFNDAKLTIFNNFIFSPTTTNTYDLGTPSNRFRKLYVDSKINLGGTEIGITVWNHLATIDQDLSTTDNVTFNSVTATTSYSLGSTTIDATQWNRLAIIDQDLSTTSDVNFNSVTIVGGGGTLDYKALRLRSDGDINRIWGLGTNQIRFIVQGGGAATMFFNGGNLWPLNNQLDLGTSSNQWKSAYLGTSIVLNGTTIDTTQWNYLYSLPFNTTSDVIFNRVTVPVSGLNSVKIFLGPASNNTGFYAFNSNNVRFNFSNGIRYAMSPSAFFAQNTGTRNLGTNAKKWNNTYINVILLPATNSNLIYLNSTVSRPTIQRSNANVMTFSPASGGVLFQFVTFNLRSGGTLGTSSNRWNQFYLNDIPVASSTNQVTTAELNISNSTNAPANTTDAGTLGDIRYNTDHLYVRSTGTNWKRLALSTW